MSVPSNRRHAGASSPRNCPTFVRTALCSAVLALAGTAHANLVLNGDFESGTGAPPPGTSQSVGAGSSAIANWTVTSDGIGNIEWEGQGYSALTTPSGVRFLDLTGNPDFNPRATISQSFATVIGATYRLTFIVGVDNDEAPFRGPVGVTVGIDGATTSFRDIDPSGTGNIWTSESLDFTATGALTSLSFLGIQGINYIGLDNVAVEFVRAAAPADPGAVPEPDALALMGLGVVAMIAEQRRQRKAGAGR